jgi:hypothetical protein
MGPDRVGPDRIDGISAISPGAGDPSGAGGWTMVRSGW